MRFIRPLLTFLFFSIVFVVEYILSCYKTFKRKYPIGTPCLLLALSMHLMLLLFSLSKENKSEVKISKSTLSLNTIQLSPPVIKKTPPTKKATPKKEVKSVKKKPKMTSKKENKPKKKPQKKETPNTGKPQKTVQTPAKAPPKTTHESFDKNQEYQQELVEILRAFLRLPEEGNVKFSLTINRNGIVESIEVNNSHSAKNRSYITEKVPELKFPSFGMSFFGQKNHTFLLNLSNDNSI
ncbi:MAG: hypothetical protein L7U87_00305 [Chlamydiales bacterium]|nr:hypothetical protein [Chlamydiales bacterium]